MAAKSIYIVIFAVLFHVFTSCELISSSTENTCRTKLNLCGLETGKQHFIAASGAKGDKGDKGDYGLAGLPGTDGLRGHGGEDGRDGAPGYRGPKGVKGLMGPPGMKGAKGEQGPLLPGPKGVKGEAGAPGFQASCSCESDEIESSGVVGDFVKSKLKWAATEYTAANVTCRDAPEFVKETGKYFLFMGPMAVTCDFETRRTCVSHNSDKNVTYTEPRPFWLSQKDVSLMDIYNLESDQLTWLQRESFTANLTIRYHCKNSAPFGKDAITLLSWNDMKIGPKSSSSSQFHYIVQNDECSKAGKNEWKSTDIVLVSPSAQILPIIDFYITDVRNETQALRIEILHLCFG